MAGASSSATLAASLTRKPASSMQQVAAEREEEALETSRRARAIRASSGVLEGQNIPEAMHVVTTNVMQVLRDSMTPSPELQARLSDLHEADHESQRDKEKAVVRIQSIFRGKSDRSVGKAAEAEEKRRSVFQRASPVNRPAPSTTPNGDKRKSPLDFVDLSKPTRSKKVDWDPQELKGPINDLLAQLNTEETEQSIAETHLAISRCLQDHFQSLPDVKKRSQTAAKELQESDAWQVDLSKRIKAAQIKTPDNIRNISDVGVAITALCRKADEERQRLENVLQMEEHLVIDDHALNELEQKKLHVAKLGKHLVELRSVQEQHGPQEEDMEQVEKLQEEITEKEGQMGVLKQWLANIDKQMKVLDATQDYVERDQKGPVPDEGVLETIQEVKGVILKQQVEPMLRQKDLESSETLQLPNDVEVEILEKESKRLQDVLDKITSAIEAVPDLQFHKDKLKNRMGQICGRFDTSSSLPEQAEPPQITADSVPELCRNLAADLDYLQLSLKPGLTQLQRFQDNMRYAQRSLDSLASQRVEVIEHVKSLKDPLIKEAMAAESEVEHAWQAYDACDLKREERFRQCIKAFHEVEDNLCGGIEEIDARLNFAKMLVSQGLQQADKLRSHCDRNRWETQDGLANCHAGRKDSGEDFVYVSLLEHKRSKLIKGAIALRQRKWRHELDERVTAGQEAAKHSRQLAAQKAAIVAEIEAQQACVKFTAHDDSEVSFEDGYTGSHRRTNAGWGGSDLQSTLGTQRPGSPGSDQSESPSPKFKGFGKNKFQSIVKAAKVRGKASPKKDAMKLARVKLSTIISMRSASSNRSLGDEPGTPPPRLKRGLGRNSNKDKFCSSRSSHSQPGMIREEENDETIMTSIPSASIMEAEGIEDSISLTGFSASPDLTSRMSSISDASSPDLTSRMSFISDAASADLTSRMSFISNASSMSMSPERASHSQAASSQQSPVKRQTAGTSTAMLPVLPPPAQTAADIQSLHQICLDLADRVAEASTTSAALASRLGGHPLDPSRHHLLAGEDAEKQKVKELMEGMIATRKAWWSSRQVLTLSSLEEGSDKGREAAACAKTKDLLRKSAKKDTEWLNHHAARILQGWIRPLMEGGRNARLRTARLRAAITISKHLRGRAGRKVAELHRREIKAAIDIQRVFCGWKARVLVEDLSIMRSDAATRIQALMRGYLARKLAKRRRTLIEFEEVRQRSRAQSSDDHGELEALAEEAGHNAVASKDIHGAEQPDMVAEAISQSNAVAVAPPMNPPTAKQRRMSVAESGKLAEPRGNAASRGRVSSSVGAHDDEESPNASPKSSKGMASSPVSPAHKSASKHAKNPVSPKAKGRSHKEKPHTKDHQNLKDPGKKDDLGLLEPLQASEPEDASAEASSSSAAPSR